MATDDGAAVGRLAEHLPADQVPDMRRHCSGPRLEELCFQVAGLWEAGARVGSPCPRMSTG